MNKQNKNGFTLIELITVVVILALVIVIVATKGFGAFNSSKEKIEEQNIAAIKEAANLLMTEVQNCNEDIDATLIADFVGTGKKCSDLIEKSTKIDESTGCLDIKLEYLINKEYVSGSGVNDIYKRDSNYTVKGCLKPVTKEIIVILPDVEEGDEIPENGPCSNTEYNVLSNTLTCKIMTNDNVTMNTTTPDLRFDSTVAKTDEGMFKEIDDLGNSWYFRGASTSNYVNFAGMCWRIVRIKGDGSTKLILEDQYTECDDTISKDKNSDGVVYTGSWNIPASNGTEVTIDPSTNEPYRKGRFGGTATDFNYLEPSYLPEKSMVNAFKYFQRILSTKINNLYDGKNISELLKSGNWCYNDNGTVDSNGNTYYDTYLRLESYNSLTLKCNGTILNKFSDNSDMYIGTINVDEMMYAGGNSQPNDSYYLMNSYQKDNALTFWLLSPSVKYYGFSSAYAVLETGTLHEMHYQGILNVSMQRSFRPSIILRTNIETDSGDGSKDNPYNIVG